MRAFRRSSTFAVRAALCAAALACATDGGPRPVLDAGAAENPATGPAVRIAAAEDRRDFAVLGGLTLRPDGADPVDRSRAVAQGTGPGGTNGAVLMLPPGLDVGALGAEAMTRALRGAGFRVLAEGDEGFERAVPLAVAVEQLWLARSPKNAPPHVAYDVRLRLSGPLPGLEAGVVADVDGKISRGGFTGAMWRMALARGLDLATEEAGAELRTVRESLARGEAASVDSTAGR